MAEAGSKAPAKTEGKVSEPATAPEPWRPFEGLRREVDRLFEDFDRDFWAFPFRRSIFDISPLRPRGTTWQASPAVDIVEKDDAFEVEAELPGLDEKDIEVKLTNGFLTIKGEKQEEKEEKKKDYYRHERRFGSFERRFDMPEGVDTDKIQARFKKGVLTITLPKKPEAIKSEKKIEVKAS